MIIDTHQHFWKYDKNKHSWIDESMIKLRQDFLPEDLEKVFQENSINGCIAVQADQSEAENNFLLKLSDENNFIKGVIGWVDFRKKDIKNKLQFYSDYKILKGFRHVVQDEPDPNFLLRPDFIKGIELLDNHGFCYEILVFPHQLGSVLEFVKKFPNQKFVIDHIGKPYIKDGFFDGWACLIGEIAKNENVYCKISGMITESVLDNWNYAQLKPYIEHVYESFGGKRIMFGSDWPVCLLAGNYKEMKSVAQKFAEQLSENEKEDFWAVNAVKFYNI